MVAFKNITVVLALTAYNANVALGLPHSSGSNILDDTNSDITSVSLTTALTQDNINPVSTVEARSYVDVNQAVAKFLIDYGTVPALCFACYKAGRAIVITATTPEQRQGAYQDIAAALNRYQPVDNQITDEDVHAVARPLESGSLFMEIPLEDLREVHGE